MRMALSYSNDDVGRGVELNMDWIRQTGCITVRTAIITIEMLSRKEKKTTPLCSGFRIDSSKIDDTYKDSITDFEINVYEESVQAEGFSDFESAWRLFFKSDICRYREE